MGQVVQSNWHSLQSGVYQRRRSDCQKKKNSLDATVLLTSAYQRLFNMSISVCSRDCDLTIEAAIKVRTVDMLSLFILEHACPPESTPREP